VAEPGAGARLKKQGAKNPVSEELQSASPERLEHPSRDK